MARRYRRHDVRLKPDTTEMAKAGRNTGSVRLQPDPTRSGHMYTRREFGTLTLAGLAVPVFGGLVDSDVVHGVRLGVQTYSFRDLPRPPGGDAVDVVIKAMTDCGISECELFAPQVEPPFNAGGRGARG